MNFLVILILLLLLIICNTQKRDFRIFNPISLFFGIWIVIFILFEVFKSKYFSINIETYFIFIIGFISYSIGYILVPQEKRIIKFSNYFNYKVFYIISSITLLVLFINTIPSLIDLANGLSFNDIYIKRVILGDNNQSGFIKAITVIVVEPFAMLIAPLWITILFSDKKKKLISIISILIILLYAYQIGRRFILLYLIISILLSIFWSKNKIKKEDYKKLILSSFIILILSSFVIINISASREISNLLDSMVTYLVGSVPFFDKMLNNTIINNQYTFGLSTLSGILTPVFIGIKGIFGMDYPVFWERVLVLSDVSKTILIGPNTRFNAFVSPFYNLFIDFNFLGVLVGMILYGAISRKIYQRFMLKSTIINTVLYLLLSIGLLLSTFQFYFTSYPYVLSFIYIYILTNRLIQHNHSFNKKYNSIKISNKENYLSK